MASPAADLEYLWSTGKADGQTADPHDILAAVRLDQKQRWKTNQPWLVEDYLRQLQALPRLPNAVNWTLELVVGEWHSRPVDQPLAPPDLQSRFPDLVDLSAHLVAFPESANPLLMIDYVCDRFEELYRSQSNSPRLEYCLANLPVNCRQAGFRRLLETELECLQRQRTSLQPDAWLERFPQYREQIRLVFAELCPGLDPDHMQRLESADVSLPSTQWVPAADPASPSQIPLTAVRLAKDLSDGPVYIRVQGQQQSARERYRLEKELGNGAFGLVYLGYDEELQRQVAVKIPTGERLSKREYADQFLAEARTVARLNHPHIVSVYDVGRAEDSSIYVVSRYIPGGTLQKRLQEQQRPDVRESVRLLIPIAQALHYAHQQGILHRDIKPANILLDADRVTPFVADFGLAIREDDELTEHDAGTPAYMSPEQAGEETHRLDGRSDVFSVGVVFYEMLTGLQPFHGKSIPEILDAVVNLDPQPPRSLQPQIPAELERICLKALAKQASDRYATAEALAADLQTWLSAAVVADTVPVVVPVKPRGLRSFEDSDAGFFLDLLPGSRNRDGLPDSIDFWKQRIEEPDASRTFTVGMICGPSGCGKSSLVKAGLLPRLSPDLVTIYLEATPEDTEDRLCAALRRRLPRLPASGDLVQLLHTIRRNRGPKVVIFLDQFEQWLHANPAAPSTPLVRALRQCNGSGLQAVIMIRDDFNLPAGRFMNAMDLRVVQGENYAVIDLFDVPHATRVLIRFGQALGHLPETGELSGEQRTFVDRVIESLQVRGRVVPVQLSILADMLSHRPWNLKTLEEIGGAARIGEVFLEEVFSSPRANPQHRQHATAARSVLKALLPAVDTKIKGASKNLTALQQAAGYQDRSNDFQDLLKILDAELRLITLTDTTDTSSNAATPPSPSWQLTHDYLVPSLRNWLTRKQKETARGRAELKLEERTLQYSSREEQRYLPGLFEWLEILWLTRRQHWSSSARQVMRTAGRLHLLRTAAIAAVLIVGGMVLRSVLNNRAAEALVTTLREAKPDGLTDLLQQADEQGADLDSLLQPLIDSADAAGASPTTQLNALPARLALVRRDEIHIRPLEDAMLDGDLPYVHPIRNRLRPYVKWLRPRWLELMRDQTVPIRKRFRAGLGLAGLDGEQSLTEWSEDDLVFLSTGLVSSFEEFQPELRDLLRPLADRLIPALTVLFDLESTTEDQQINATFALTDFAGNDVKLLARLLTRATARQTEILYPKIAAYKSGPVRDELLAIVREQPNEILGQLDRVRLGCRRANAAIALLRQGERESYFDALRISSDPESLSQFINRCRDWGVTPNELLESLDRCAALRASVQGPDWKVESRVMYGLIVALGSYSLKEIPQSMHDNVFRKMCGLYETDPSAAVHSASGWLLRTWGLEEILRKLDEVEVAYDAEGEREWFRLHVRVQRNPAALFGDPSETDAPKQHSLTFVVFPAGEYRLGSPDFDGGELYREKEYETPRIIRLTRPVALCDREVTWELYDAFDGGLQRSYLQKISRINGWDQEATSPACAMDWFTAIEFFRWLTAEYRGNDEGWQCYQHPDAVEKDRFGVPQVGRLLVERGGFRMPTDSEWEVGGRSGQRTAYSFGGDVNLLWDYGWFMRSSEQRSHPVANKLPGIGGLFDFHGNVSEWTHDSHDIIRSGRIVVDPQDSNPFGNRVLRGGSWAHDAAYCRSALRVNARPTDPAATNGLRLAMSPTETLVQKNDENGNN